MSAYALASGNLAVVSTARKDPCKVASTGADIALSGLQTIDGVALVAGDRVLLKDQADPTNNGIWTVASASWSRSSDLQAGLSTLRGTKIFVTDGIANKRVEFDLTSSDGAIVGTNSLTFSAASSGTPVNSNFPGVFCAADYGAIGDLASVASTGVTATSGRPDVVVADATFVAGDAGKWIMVPGAGVSGADLETTIAAVTDATHIVLSSNAGTTVSGVSATVPYGTDNAGALQAWVDAACAVGGFAYIPPGSYKSTAEIIGTDHCYVLGTGMPFDKGLFWNANQNVTQWGGWKGSVIVPSPGTNGLTFKTLAAVQIAGISIIYPKQAPANSGVTAFKLANDGTSGNLQVASTIENCWANGADRGYQIVDCYSWAIRNCYSTEHQTFGIYVTDTTGFSKTSYGDWLIEGGQYYSGSVSGPFAHILLAGGGGGKIIGVKTNTAGSVNYNQTSAVQISPDPNISGTSFEPLTITGCSFEGTFYGVNFYQNTGSDATVSLAALSGNQIWAAVPIAVQGQSAGFVTGLDISGGALQAQGANTTNISMAGAKSVDISGVTFTVTQGTSTAITVGANCSNVRQSGNVANDNVTLAPGLTRPALPASGTAATNTNPYAVTIYLSGGTGTAVAVNGMVIYGQSSSSFLCMVTLNPGDTLTLTYTSAPTWTWQPINP